MLVRDAKLREPAGDADADPDKLSLADTAGDFDSEGDGDDDGDVEGDGDALRDATLVLVTDAQRDGARVAERLPEADGDAEMERSADDEPEILGVLVEFAVPVTDAV